MNGKEARLTALSRRVDDAASRSTSGAIGEASLENSLSILSSAGNDSSKRSSNVGNATSSEFFRSSLASADSTTDKNGNGNSLHSDSFGGSARRRPSMDKLRNSSQAQSVKHDLNRLKFHRLGLYGREEELAVLHKAHEEWSKTIVSGPAKPTRHAELVPPLNLHIIAGASGTGKSAIVKEFRKQHAKREPNALFVSGKFDQHSSTPYSAFIAAFSQLCEEAISLSNPTIRNAIYDAVGTRDYHLLLDLIPNIGELVYEVRGRVSDDTRQSSEQEYDIVKSEKKRKFLLQLFLASTATADHKLVIFLDDLQWVDQASLGLLEMILTEDLPTHQHIYIICAHRDDILDSQHVFSQSLKSIEANRKQKIPKLLVRSMSPEAVRGFITELFNSNDDETEEFAKLAYARVQGNVFYLVQFLTALRDGDLLQYNIATMKWTWDVPSIQISTVVASNVLTILMDKTKKLPKRQKHILQIAACLGSSFEEVVITILDRKLSHSTALHATQDKGASMDVMREDDTNESNQQSTQEALGSIVDAGLLEALAASSGNWSYCFAHDQIKLAANALLHDDQLALLKFEIGCILYENRSLFNYASLLFSVVDMLNEGTEHTAPTDLLNKRHEITSKLNTMQLLVDVNFEAGKTAVKNGAFGASIRYLERAISYIPQHEQWNEHNELSLQLYNMLIKAKYSMRMLEDVIAHIQTVLAQTCLSVLEKTVAYLTMITILATHQHNHAGAIALAVDQLGQLGVTLRPRLGALPVVVALVKTKSLLRKYPLETLLDQVEMQDMRKQIALDYIAAMNSSMYAASPELLVCTVLKTLRWSLKYGLSKGTSRCVGVFSLLEMALGDTKAATRAAKFAIELAEKQGLMTSEYAPIASVYGFVLPWTTSLHDCRKQVYQGYAIGTQTGDLEYGYMNIVLYCFFCFCSGKPLTELEVSMRNYGCELRSSNQFLQLQFLCLTWQTILNLMGRSDDPLVLSGEAMDQEEMLRAADVDKNPPLRAQLQCHRLQLAVYYRDFKLAGKLVGLSSNIAAVNPANPIIWRTALFEGVAAFELVRQKRLSWKRTALKALSKIQKWVDTGNVNCVHILYLLRAEHAAMKKKAQKARLFFDLAIVTAARNGFRNDKALACERCAEWYRFTGDDDTRAKDYLQMAFNYYEEMHAFGKLDEMANRSPSLRSCHVVVGTEKSEERPDAGSLPVSTKSPEKTNPPVLSFWKSSDSSLLTQKRAVSRTLFEVPSESSQ